LIACYALIKGLMQEPKAKPPLMGAKKAT
jgi:hypothetical protein